MLILFQIGGGLWGGCLAALTGVMGVFSVAKDCCPLKSNFQRVAHTVFLALSLVSLAVSQLVLVVACIGLSRDSNKNDVPPEENPEVKINVIKTTAEIIFLNRSQLF